jgi:hypothetical protein
MTKISNLYSLTNYISANSSGNVVIATPTSGFALDVTGTGRFTGALTAAQLFAITSSNVVGGINSTNSTGGYLTWSTNGTIIADIGTEAQIFGSGSGTTFGINARGAQNLVLGTNNTVRFILDSNGAATFTKNVTIGQAAAATNIKLIFNGVASKAAGIEFQQSGTPQWYIGNGIASEDNNFELYNSNGTMAMKIIKSTNAIAFQGATTFNSSVTASGNINAGTSSAALQANGYQVAKYSYFGYSSGYPGIIIGNTGGQTLFFNVDISGNPSGAFNGGGQEYVWRNAGSFITPNASNNGYNTLFGWNSSGSLTVNQAATFSSSVTATSVGVNGAPVYSGLESSTGTFGSTVALLSLAVKDGTYNPRATVSFKTQTGSAYSVIFDSAYSSGWAATNWIFNSGNVGIGTTSPTSILNVVSSTNNNIVSPEDQVRVINTFSGGVATIGFSSNSGGNQDGRAGIVAGKDPASGVTGFLALVVRKDAGTWLEGMRITSGGAVNIGTAFGGTGRRLTVVGGAQFTAGDNSGSSFNIVPAANGQDGCDLNLSYYTGTGYGPLTFTVGGAQQMRIDASGAVIMQKHLQLYCSTGSQDGMYIQNTSNNTSANAIIFRGWNASTTGSIATYVNLTTYNTSSDYRLKEDLKQFSGLDLVSKLKMYDFKWKESDWRMYGGLAHEIADVLPYAVNGEKDAVDEEGNIKSQGVDYSTIVPLLIQSIQELSAKVTALENK